MVPIIGLAAFSMVIPITLAILAVMVFVMVSYMQVIGVYTRSGGSYVVARDNFGPNVAQVAAVALLIDYTVTVAVQTSAGTAALTSAFRGLVPYTVPITVGVVAAHALRQPARHSRSGVDLRDPHVLLRGLACAGGDHRVCQGGARWPPRTRTPRCISARVSDRHAARIPHGIGDLLLPARVCQRWILTHRDSRRCRTVSPASGAPKHATDASHCSSCAGSSGFSCWALRCSRTGPMRCRISAAARRLCRRRSATFSGTRGWERRSSMSCRPRQS